MCSGFLFWCFFAKNSPKVSKNSLTLGFQTPGWFLEVFGPQKHTDSTPFTSGGIWMFPKIVVPPNHPLKNRLFHFYSLHFGVFPLFSETSKSTTCNFINFISQFLRLDQKILQNSHGCKFLPFTCPKNPKKNPPLRCWSRGTYSQRSMQKLLRRPAQANETWRWKVALLVRGLLKPTFFVM